MTAKLEYRDPLPFPAETVMEKMLDMDFIQRWSVVQTAINPKATITERTDDRARVEIDLEEPIPTFGNIKAHMTFDWDLKKRFCTWTRKAEGMGGKSNVYGSTAIEANGDNACTFVDVINVEIKVPVIGKKMEKLVTKHMDDNRKEKMDYMLKELS